mmetsp:Transcript_33616/g.77567  ORF Transcript_33616/g.77567 Transcript_33616/m.77567 type:complete len:80 (+) Transcript_33616:955-1194(+)
MMGMFLFAFPADHFFSCQIEDWSRKHMQGDAWDLECRIQEHWHQKRIFQEVDPDLWIRLRIPSVSTSPQDEEDDGFVRI